jgi:predicted esterase
VVTIDSALANWLAKRQSDQQPGAVRTEAETKPVSVPVVTGRIYAFPLSVRYYPTPAAYFTGSARTAWRQELAADREENIDPLMAVSYAVEAQSAFVYVPASYDGSREFGVYVDVRSESAGALPAGYDAVCDRHQLIWISPHASGNNVPAARRCALALDALASLQRRYRIDRRRIYAGGFSGGGTIAARLGVLYPEIVRGIMIHARGVYLADTPAGGGNVWPGHFSFLTGDDLRRIARQGLRVVFVTGPGDMNYGHVRASVAQWTQAGFAVKGFDVKGLGHEDAPADILNDAMVWLGEKL